MNATCTGNSRVRTAAPGGMPPLLMAALGMLTGLALLLPVQGCGTTAAAATAIPGPTPASALRLFSSYATAQKVALANNDELLALSLLTGSQLGISTAAYGLVATTGGTVTGPVYGKPTLYVPKLTTYPQWFAAAVPERPSAGAPIQTALLVFDRPSAKSTWALSVSVLLNPGTPAPKVAIGPDGYATALATSDPALRMQPNEVGATHATIADDGPSSAAAPLVKPGPQTTGLYQANAGLARQAAAQGNTYTWELEGTSYPFFALRTTDGGALVLYTLTLSTLTVPTHPHATGSPTPIFVPAALRPLVPARPPLRHELTTYSTFSYAALDPPASATSAAIQLVGSGGGLTYVHGT